MWGGHYGPDKHKQLHCLYRIRARPTKIPDFVPFYDEMVLGKSFFKFFFEIFEKSKKILLTILTSKGPPFEKKFKNFKKKYFFANNHTFSFWIWILYVFSFLLRYVTIIYLKISNFDLFMLEIFIFCLDPTAASIAKTIVQRLLFMVSIDSWRSKKLNTSHFWALGCLLMASGCLNQSGP